MNVIAKESNEAIAAVNPFALEMLSGMGKELYFPKGILTQSAEAKKLAKRFNATIGTALEDGEAMNLPCVMKGLRGISPSDALLYASSMGMMELREAWKAKLLADNPSLAADSFSLPVVTSGLTHGLSVAADLFVEPGDTLLLPDMIWGNYRMTFGLRRGAVIKQYRFFKGEGLDVEAFEEALDEACGQKRKVVVLLNFPNNPTGYTPTPEEADGLVKALVAAAEDGANIVAITDDAYFGLFFDDHIKKDSIFSQLAGAHPRLLAVKADAATKEVFVWGLRVGFISFSIGGAKADSPLYRELVNKSGGCIRGVISNCSQLSQKIVLDALRSPDFEKQRAAKVAVMKARAMKVREVLAQPKFADAWTVYPFNSGYFMCVKLRKVNAEKLRVHLLQKHGVGTISISDTDLRIAFSSLEVGQIQEVFDLILQGVKELS